MRDEEERGREERITDKTGGTERRKKGHNITQKEK